jgi:nitrogen-specific signal transduction histidine kinase
VTDLWTILRADHDRIRDLLDRLNSSPAMTVDGVDERQAIALELIAAVSSHEAAEELAIWGAVRQCYSVAS